MNAEISSFLHAALYAEDFKIYTLRAPRGMPDGAALYAEDFEIYAHRALRGKNFGLSFGFTPQT